MIAGSKYLAVPGTDFQFGGYSAADAKRRCQILSNRRHVAFIDVGCDNGTARSTDHVETRPPGRSSTGLRYPRRHSKRPPRLPGKEASLFLTVMEIFQI